MTTPTIDDRDALAQRYGATIAHRLRWAVHKSNAAEVAALIEPLDGQQLRTLAVVLASQASRPRSRPDDGEVDEVAIDRAIDGQHVELTPAEKRAAVQLMRSRGYSRNDTAVALRMSSDTLKTLWEATS